MVKRGRILPVLVLRLTGERRLYAAPVLQLYLAGGVYDEATNSWLMAPPGSSGGRPFRLWAVGNVSGPSAKGVSKPPEAASDRMNAVATNGVG